MRNTRYRHNSARGKMKNNRHIKYVASDSDSESDNDDNDKLFYSDGDKIYYYCDVTKKSVLELIKAIQDRSDELVHVKSVYGVEPEIKLYIHSDGGDLFAGMSAYEHIRKNPVPIKTIVDGSVSSAATLIAMGGHKREMTGTSMVLIHQLRTGFWGKYADLEDEMKSSNKAMELLKGLYIDNTKMTATQLNKIIQREEHLTAKECLKYGFIHEII